MSDLISRQAAIDAIVETFKRIPTNAIRAKMVIEEIPSAKQMFEYDNGFLMDSEKIRNECSLNKEYRFYIGGRLFAIRELPQ